MPRFSTGKNAYATIGRNDQVLWSAQTCLSFGKGDMSPDEKSGDMSRALQGML